MLPINQAKAATAGPNSTGTNADDSSIGTIAWTNRDNDKISDNLYATTGNMSSGNISYYLKTTNFGFSVPTGATINGISVEIERFGGDPGFRDNAIRVVKNGAIGTTDKSSVTAWAGADPNSYVTYGGASDLWGESWTYSDINSTNFGFAISVKKISGAVKIASIDHIRITINYTANNPVPTTTSISPTNKTAGDSGFDLTVNGTNFISSSVVSFSGSARATTFVSANQVTAAIPASDLTTTGTFSITVTNPTPGGGTSNGQIFTVNAISTTTALNTSGSPSVEGMPVTFTASVIPASNGAPSGIVTFKDGAATLGTGTLNGNNPGVGIFITSALSVAGSPHSITAVYEGDSNHSTSTSSIVLQSIAATPVEPTPEFSETPKSITPEPSPLKVPGSIPVEPVPEPIGPVPTVPEISPTLPEGEISSPDTTTAEMSIFGGTISSRPIKVTPGDTTPPAIVIVKKQEGILKDSTFSLSAYALDTQGVIEYLAYSIDGGKSWRPVTIADTSKIGQSKVNFSVNSPDLPDGNYEILLSARDNSENKTIKSAENIVLDVEQPQIISLLMRSGSLEIPSATPTEITISANLAFEIVGAFRGGVTEGTITIGGKEYDFIYDSQKDNWTSTINNEVVGRQKASIYLLDGANNKLDEKIFDFDFLEPFSLGAENDKEVTIFEFNYQNDAWQVFNADTYKKNNPTDAKTVTKAGIILPAGKYYIKSKPTENQNVISKLSSYFSRVFSISGVSSLSGGLRNITDSKIEDTFDYSSENSAKILDSVPSVKDHLSSFRGNDIILFNLDPRSYVSLEQLSILSEIKKANQNVKIFVTTDQYYLQYCQSVILRGNYQVDVISSDNNYFNKNIFQYRSPGFIFINNNSEIEMIRNGYLTKQEIINIIGGV